MRLDNLNHDLYSLTSIILCIFRQFKAKGNAALQAGNTSEAIEMYTKAINADGSNHVYFSNRSAAYLKKGDANNALDDAISCIGLKPDFAKGYSRKGAALRKYQNTSEFFPCNMPNV